MASNNLYNIIIAIIENKIKIEVLKTAMDGYFFVKIPDSFKLN